MNLAAEILRLIDTVDLADKVKLDEIDLAVEKYWTALDVWREESGRRVTLFNGHPIHVAEPYQYTRSRDALKMIRPGDWRFWVHSEGTCEAVKRNETEDEEIISQAATEELAELHAIIKAIEYERSRAEMKVAV